MSISSITDAYFQTDVYNFRTEYVTNNIIKSKIINFCELFIYNSGTFEKSNLTNIDNYVAINSIKKSIKINKIMLGNFSFIKLFTFAPISIPLILIFC